MAALPFAVAAVEGGCRGDDREPVVASFCVVGVVIGVCVGVVVGVIVGVAFRFPFVGDAAVGSNTSSEPEPDSYTSLTFVLVFGRLAFLDLDLGLSFDPVFSFSLSFT